MILRVIVFTFVGIFAIAYVSNARILTHERTDTYISIEPVFFSFSRLTMDHS